MNWCARPDPDKLHMSDWATDCISVALFQPKPMVEATGFAEVPISVTAETGFHQLGTFFDRVGKLGRLVSLNDFRLSGISQPTGSVRAELNMATYMFRGDAPVPPARPGAPAPPPATPAAPGARR